MTSASDARRRSRRPAWASRNYSLLTAAAFVTNLGSHGALIAMLTGYNPASGEIVVVDNTLKEIGRIPVPAGR